MCHRTLFFFFFPLQPLKHITITLSSKDIQKQVGARLALRPQLADPWAIKRQPQPSPQMCELVSSVLLSCIALWSQIAFLSPPHHAANVLGTRKEIYCNSTAPIHALGIHMVLLCRRYITNIK